MRRLLLALGIICLAAPASAVPLTYTFVQSGASLPGLTMSASLTIDGTLADLPTISCFPCLVGTPLNFGHLLAFSFTVPRPAPLPFSATLADFTTQIAFPQPSLYPQWNISPTGIEYHDNFADYSIIFASGTISFVSDSGVAGCIIAGACIVSGSFVAAPVATPEPQTWLLFGSGLVAVAYVARKRRIGHA